MTHFLTTDPALEELRRQLRDGEITLFDYKRARATLVEPAPVMCATPGCTREAHSVERGVPHCAVCGPKARNGRRGR